MRIACLLGLTFALAACSGSGSPAPLEGTVILLQQNSFGLVGDDGGMYEPINLPAPFATDGARVRIDARFTGQFGAFGELIEILAIVNSQTPPPGRPVTFDGTVTFVQLEGNFFGIIGDDGVQYDPLDLPPAFAQDGLRVTVEARVRDDIFGIHQWGPIIEIESIDALP